MARPNALLNPETCTVLRFETGFRVGKSKGQSAFEEWSSDARYERHGAREPHVTRFSDLGAAQSALRVREDELLATGFVRLDESVDLVTLLAHHDPWKTWLRAKASPTPLTELWNGLAPQAELERVRVSVQSVEAERIVLHTRAGVLQCDRPLHPDELGEMPTFMMPLLVRHFSLTGAVNFFWDPITDGHFLSAGRTEYAYSVDDESLRRIDPTSERLVRATSATLMEFILASLT